MLTKNARRSVAALLLASAASIPLAGCDTIERETGFNRNTQMGAAGGAAFGGIIAALANANPAWIAASVILGGVTGGVIGDHLGKTDAEKHAQTNLHALSSLGEGQTSRWSDSQTGNSGSTKQGHETGGRQRLQVIYGNGAHRLEDCQPGRHRLPAGRRILEDAAELTWADDAIIARDALRLHRTLGLHHAMYEAAAL